MQPYITETDDARRGAVLGMVLIVVALVSLLGGGLMHYTSTVAAETGREVSKAQAFWAAEAGLQRLLAIGRGGNDTLEELGYNGEGVLEGAVLRGTYRVDVYPDPMEERVYHIVSTGTSAGNQEAVVEVNSELPTFTQYLMFSHLGVTPDDQPIYFGDGDTIAGPIYANGELNIWHDHPNETLFAFPTPDGDDWLISSAADSVNLNAGTLEVFNDDGSMYPDGQPQSRLRLNQPEVSTEPLQEFYATKKAGANLSLSGDYDMVFHDNGSVVYVPHGGGASITNDFSSGGELSIYLDGNAYIQGVVDGDVTLVVEQGIHIVDDVQYESAQTPGPWDNSFNSDAVDDYLTLLTPEYVRIDADQGNNGKPSNKAEDRTVHASIFVTEDNALTGSEWYGLCAEKYDSNVGSPHLNLYGGVAQYRRGLLARPPNVTASGTAPQPFGYYKNFLFDPRMAGRNGYPYTTYLVSGWEYR